MIRHTVAFRLKHPRGSAEEAAFLADGMALAKIPGVKKFEQLEQVSPKNDFHFGYSMEFDDQAAYTGYNDHPDHVAYVRDRWIGEVEAFLEIDYVPLNRG
jgi:hypothetical protein